MTSLRKIIYSIMLLLAFTLPFYDFYNPIILYVTNWECEDQCIVTYNIENSSMEELAIEITLSETSLSRDKESNQITLQTVFSVKRNIYMSAKEKRTIVDEIETKRFTETVKVRRTDSGGIVQWWKGLKAVVLNLFLGIE